ncbi:hypothetical protein GCM10023320_39860 [Pseudonocardia adelaidensis]|uniref:Uncharacterized protein n=1 Tax=Pseudonocardia adelaidensis TaxID=648754 RepID=A0ABP9NSJ7_9PSEU
METEWQLRARMAERGLFATRSLVPLPAARGFNCGDGGAHPEPGRPDRAYLSEVVGERARCIASRPLRTARMRARVPELLKRRLQKRSELERNLERCSTPGLGAEAGPSSQSRAYPCYG